MISLEEHTKLVEMARSTAHMQGMLDGIVAAGGEPSTEKARALAFARGLTSLVGTGILGPVPAALAPALEQLLGALG